MTSASPKYGEGVLSIEQRNSLFKGRERALTLYQERFGLDLRKYGIGFPIASHGGTKDAG